MGNKGKIRYAFASSNTSRGFYTFIPELVQELKKVFILKGAPGSGRATFIKLLGESMAEQGYEIEYWISSMDPVNLDGVYIPQLDAAVINGSLPEPIEPKYPGATGHIIYMGDYWDKESVEAKSKEIIVLANRVENQKSKAYNILKNAARVKDEIRALTSGYLNMEKIQELIHELAGQIIDEQPEEKHYFASAVTADGVVNYVDELSVECKKRYIFKGPTGSGKSTVITEIARKAATRGYRVEYYHCGLEPDNICMVIIRDIALALVDAGNMELVTKPWDIVIDMSTYLDDYDRDKIGIRYSEASRNYEVLLEEARTELESAAQTLKELKKIYSAAMDFELLDKKRNEIWKQIID